jgi:uncharacterized protein YjeT (DUF2065 family)
MLSPLGTALSEHYQSATVPLKRPVNITFFMGIVNIFARGLQQFVSFGRLMRMKTLITLIGLVLIIEGIPYVASPEAMQQWLKQLVESHPDKLRAMGLTAMAIGLFLCVIAQRSGIFG